MEQKTEMTKPIVLGDVSLPEFGMPKSMPVIPRGVYQSRLRALRNKAQTAGYSYVLIYADREHDANLQYLTGFGPRFEEMLLIIATASDAIPTLLAGNECYGYAQAEAQIELNVVLYQPLSLMGQSRTQSQPLSKLLPGSESEGRIGVVGWKYADNDPTWIEIPSFLVETLRALGWSVENAGALLMAPNEQGLRSVNEAEQLAVFEHRACFTSEGIKQILKHLKPGLKEYELAQRLDYPGWPLSCHLMLSSGERAWQGLRSPSDKIITYGDAFTTAYGLQGALNCRAGFIVDKTADLPVPDYLERLVFPYFRAVVSWYETIGLGVEAGAVYEAVHQHIGDPFFGVSLNPGHLIHLDEWTHSPFNLNNNTRLWSGAAIQMDIIPATGSAYFTANAEDGIALADANLRQTLTERYPEMMARVQARRTFMQNCLGINLKPEVLPFSNIPAWYTPLLLAQHLACKVQY